MYLSLLLIIRTCLSFISSCVLLMILYYIIYEYNILQLAHNKFINIMIINILFGSIKIFALNILCCVKYFKAYTRSIRSSLLRFTSWCTNAIIYSLYSLSISFFFFYIILLQSCAFRTFQWVLFIIVFYFLSPFLQRVAVALQSGTISDSIGTVGKNGKSLGGNIDYRSAHEWCNMHWTTAERLRLRLRKMCTII